jgi:hypothetical protein
MNIEEPGKDLDEVRRVARQRGKNITPERLAELREHERTRVGASGRRASVRRDPVHGPKPWVGSMGAVSMPIVGEHGPEPFMTGDGNDWLFPLGAGSTRTGYDGVMPRRLGIGGWIYLRANHCLVARARFRGVERRDHRVEHIASPGGVREDRGAGAVLAVDPESWETVDIPLSASGEEGQGYRYYTIAGDHPTFALVG